MATAPVAACISGSAALINNAAVSQKLVCARAVHAKQRRDGLAGAAHWSDRLTAVECTRRMFLLVQSLTAARSWPRSRRFGASARKSEIRFP